MSSDPDNIRQLTRMQEKLHRAEFERAEYKRQVDELKQSLSWRITEPVRWVREKLQEGGQSRASQEAVSNRTGPIKRGSVRSRGTRHQPDNMVKTGITMRYPAWCAGSNKSGDERYEERNPAFLRAELDKMAQAGISAVCYEYDLDTFADLNESPLHQHLGMTDLDMECCCAIKAGITPVEEIDVFRFLTDLNRYLSDNLYMKASNKPLLLVVAEPGGDSKETATAFQQSADLLDIPLTVVFSSQQQLKPVQHLTGIRLTETVVVDEVATVTLSHFLPTDLYKVRHELTAAGIRPPALRWLLLDNWHSLNSAHSDGSRAVAAEQLVSLSRLCAQLHQQAEGYGPVLLLSQGDDAESLEPLRRSYAQLNIKTRRVCLSGKGSSHPEITRLDLNPSTMVHFVNQLASHGYQAIHCVGELTDGLEAAIIHSALTMVKTIDSKLSPQELRVHHKLPEVTVVLDSRRLSLEKLNSCLENLSRQVLVPRQILLVVDETAKAGVKNTPEFYEGMQIDTILMKSQGPEPRVLSVDVLDRVTSEFLCCLKLGQFYSADFLFELGGRMVNQPRRQFVTANRFKWRDTTGTKLQLSADEIVGRIKAVQVNDCKSDAMKNWLDLITSGSMFRANSVSAFYPGDNLQTAAASLLAHYIDAAGSVAPSATLNVIE